MLFPNLPESSKVWIYQSQTPISAESQIEMQKKLDLFISGWAAHGDELFGTSAILEDYFVVLVVDEAKVKASGCSIDTSVHFIRQLGKTFQLDFFSRLNMLIENDNQKRIVHFSDLAEFGDSFIYDPLIKSLGEFRKSWKVKISESRFLN